MLGLGHGEYLYLMAIYVNSAGKPIINSSGAPIDCSTCPCGPVGTVTCCHNALLSACYTFPIAGITTNTAGCVGNLCPSLNDTYTMNHVSGCTWRSAEKVIGLCTDCGDSVKATLDIQAANFTFFCDSSSLKCVWRVVITQDGAGDPCNDYAITYIGCFLKTDDPLTDKVLTFDSSNTLCKDFPATITLSAC